MQLKYLMESAASIFRPVLAFQAILQQGLILLEPDIEFYRMVPDIQGPSAENSILVTSNHFPWND